MKLLLVCCALSLLHSFAFAESKNVVIKGLFKNAAIVSINGQQTTLKVGQEKYGVKLLSASSERATLEIDGIQKRLGVSRQLGGVYREPEKATVRIASKKNGHYWVNGQINGRQVRFIVDTGASLISMNLTTAKRLGINYQAGKYGVSKTANGTKEIRVVTLDKVTIGGITLHNIKASVGLDNALPVTLLGNSFLAHVNLSKKDGVLTLEKK